MDFNLSQSTKLHAQNVSFNSFNYMSVFGFHFVTKLKSKMLNLMHSGPIKIFVLDMIIPTGAIFA